MITEEQTELLIEKLLKHVQDANTYFLKNIGKKVKRIGMLKPTEAQQLVQILKYGGSYEEIVKAIAKYTGLTIKDIDEIFKAYAKKDQLFYKQFYKYRNIPFIPYEENIALKRQTEALANIVKNEAYNFMRSNVLGYTINGEFKGLRETYNDLLDTALMNVGQGKETYETSVANILKEIGGSGLRTIEYESGRSMRLDSAIRMHLKGRLRELHNENQKLLGEEFGADGIEISVHENPAPDHEEAQGRQFSNEEYEKLNAGLEAKDYKGNIYSLDHDGNGSYRPISEMNCYHRIFSIILGVSKPVKTDKELQQIRDDNNKGFELDGKHYTNYQGTQLQRSLEREIRKQKDIQIVAKEANNKELIAESQSNITALTKKYKELAEISGLPTKAERLRVSGYKRVKINEIPKATKTINSNIPAFKAEELQEALDDYSHGETYIEINDALRREEAVDVDIKEQITKLDEATTDNIGEQTLYRIVNARHYPGELTEYIGKTLEEKAYMSTTKDESLLKKFNEEFKYAENPIYMRIKTSKNTKGADFDKYFGKQNNQKEVLLERDLNYKITDIYDDGGDIWMEITIEEKKPTKKKIKTLPKAN